MEITYDEWSKPYPAAILQCYWEWQIKWVFDYRKAACRWL